MEKKYVVLEVRPEANLGDFVNFAMEQRTNFAIVNRVSGLFEELPAVAPPSRTDIFDLKRVKRNGRNVSVWEELAGKRPIPMLTREFSDDEELPKSSSCKHAKIDTVSGEEEFLEPSSRRRAKPLDRSATEKTSTRLSNRNTEISCDLCNMTLTGNLRYQNTRMREHIQRHMNDFTVQCGHCETKGILRDHIRKHHSIRHIGEKLIINPIVLDTVYHERFAATWQVCFPGHPAATLPLSREQKSIKEKEVLEETAVSLDEFHDTEE